LEQEGIICITKTHNIIKKDLNKSVCQELNLLSTGSKRSHETPNSTKAVNVIVTWITRNYWSCIWGV